MSTDKPLSNEEIVEAAQKRRPPKGQDFAWYDAYKTATVDIPCPLCGWRDGDGICTCFYSSELGAVTHQNSQAGAERTMTPEQVSLYQLRTACVFLSEETREAYLRQAEEEALEAKRKHNLEHPHELFRTHPDGTEYPEAEFRAQFNAKVRAEPLATDPKYAGWICLSTIPTVGRIFLHEPHPNCGGIKESDGPYHYRCSKCGVEVREWEHGIDYDLG